MDASELDAITDDHLPRQFQINALKAVFEARRLARHDCDVEFEKPEADNVRPFYTRGKLEALLRGAATLADGLESSVVRDRFWNHTEINSGPITLTAHAVQRPCELVAQADYRKTLAADNEYVLFSDGMNVGDRLYVLLLHSPFKGRSPEEEKQFAHLPGSAYLAYPSGDLTYYAHRMDLFAKFPNVVESFMPQEWDEAAKVHYFWHASQRTA